MEVLLRLKHWQVFLFVGATTILVLASRFVLVLTDVMIQYPDAEVVVNAIGWLDGGAALIYLAWLYAVGTTLNDRVGDAYQRRAGIFRVCIFAIGVLMIATNMNAFGSDMRLTLSLTFISLCLHIYCDYFAAHSLVLAESNRTHFGGTFFSFLFSPIGIWWIQPRINRVVAGDWENVNPDTPLDHNLDQQPQS